MTDSITVVSAEEFSKDPQKYIGKGDLRIVSADSPLTISIMSLAEPRPRPPVMEDLESKEKKPMRLQKIKLDSDNRMLRFGFGKNQGRWFARLDLWFFGVRLS